MTREEAVKLLKEYALRVKPFYEPLRTEYTQAINMAIESLTSQNLTKPNKTCEVDLISREDAVNAICKHSCYTEYGLCSNVGFPRTACGYVEAIQLLPSAESVKHGEWKYYNYSDINNPYVGWYECSVCKQYEHIEHKFCPNCGADMRGNKE